MVRGFQALVSRCFATSTSAAAVLLDGVDLEKRSVPEATLASSRQSFPERVSAPLPARIRNPILEAMIDDELYIAIKESPAALAKMGKAWRATWDRASTCY